MKKYLVTVHFEGCVDREIEAKNQAEAESMAEELEITAEEMQDSVMLEVNSVDEI